MSSLTTLTMSVKVILFRTSFGFDSEDFDLNEQTKLRRRKKIPGVKKNLLFLWIGMATNTVSFRDLDRR